MYLWRRLAAPRWLEANEEPLRIRAGDNVALIERPGRKSVEVEIVCRSKAQARRLEKEFGGRSEVLPRNWLQRYARARERPTLRIGKRLVIRDGGAPALRSRDLGPSHIVVPAGTAFGTGEHATTAMTLRMLEEITRRRNRDWQMADLGTGSGILALAGRVFGAKTVSAIDNDPRAISTALGNARRNRIRGGTFAVADAMRWHPPHNVDVLTANLYSELLIEGLPVLRRYLKKGADLILSGIMRHQEKGVVRVLRCHDIEVKTIRRKGKWIAIHGRFAA